MATDASPVSLRTLVFYDDAKARTFEPFALSRPLCEMRVGALLMRERWEHALRAQSKSFVGAPQLAHFTEAGSPVAQNGIIPAGTVLVNSRAAISLDELALAVGMNEGPARDHAGHEIDDSGRQIVIAEHTARGWYLDGLLAAIELQRDLDANVLEGGRVSLEEIASMDSPPEVATAAGSHVATHAHTVTAHLRVDVRGSWLNEVWDIVRHLSPMLADDIPQLSRVVACEVLAAGTASDRHVLVTGEHALYLERGAAIEPYTVFDTALGPVMLRAGAVVQAFTRVVGPCYIGANSTVMGDRISGSSIGDTCRVHGELSATVFVGHSNKGHDGFVGHSIVGRWVNMGAGTITSNLKNTYGAVALWTPQGVRDTGLQFLGTLFGDHAKTGIGVKLTTGCVLGTGANVFDRMPPKAVEPFAWGSGAPYDSYSIDKFVETAERMMSRRSVALNEEGRAYLREVHAARWETV